MEYPFSSDEFYDAWLDWLDYKKEAHKFTYKTNKSEQLALKRLKRLSDNNEKIAIAIIEQSIENNWKGLFALDKNDPLLTEAKKPKFLADKMLNDFGIKMNKDE